MNTMLGSTQSEFVVASSLVTPSAEAPAIGRAKLKNDRPPAKRSWLRKMAPLTFAPHLIALLIGVAGTLAWQTYGDTARSMMESIASSNKQQLNAMSLDLGAMRQSIDGLTTSMDRLTTNITANHENIVFRVDQLTAGQEQMTREVGKLQSAEQSIVHKNSAPPARPSPTPAPKPVLRSLQAPIDLTPAKNP